MKSRATRNIQIEKQTLLPSRDLNRPDFVYLNKTAEGLLSRHIGCRLIRIGTWRERRDLENVNELIRIDHFKEVRDEDVFAEGSQAK